jgi:hypothetical protein
MPAVSKAQQRFMGMVYATKKGDMTNPSPEVAQAAASMKKSDAKDFASTKHKKLPEKKVAKEAYYGGEEQRKKDEKKKKIDAFMNKAMPKRTFDQMGRETDRRTGKLKEATNFSQRDKIMKRAKPLHKHLFKNLHKGDRKGDVNERVDYDDSKQMKKYADEKKKHKEQDKRMKFGKFYKRAEDSRERLRPGEVKRYDKAKGKWVSNKD